MKKKTIPIKKHETITLEITSIGRKGDGVGRYKDFVIVVPQTKMGETYEIKITDVHETYAFGIIEV